MRPPIELIVNYALHLEFRTKVQALPNCRVLRIFEIKCNELILYWIEAPDKLDDYIVKLAFMTFIKNPEFQKHYSECSAFKRIADEWKNAKNDK
jgi:hypothetical protein